jgi:hypothetical protein
MKRLAVLTLCAAALSALAVSAQDVAGPLIVNASAVRLRASPSTTAAIVAELPLGTELVEVKPQTMDEWIHVRTSAGAEGWLSSLLATRVRAAGRLAAIEQIIQERLARQGDGFPAWTELLDFVRRAASDLPDAETRARFALHELRATSRAAGAVPFMGHRANETEPYATWLKARDNIVFYNEVGGAWMLAHSAFLDAYDRHRGAAAADEILWASVLNGLGGECEGYIPCIVGMTNTLEGEYLRRLPRGRRAAEALARAADRLKSAVELSGDKDFFDPPSDCADLRKAAEPLRDALERTTGPNRDVATALLGRLTSRCAPRAR